MVDIKKSYHLREVAEYFSCSVRTIQRCVINGEIKIHSDKFGKRRVSHEELLDIGHRNKILPCDEPYPRAKNNPEKTAEWLIENMGDATTKFNGAEFLKMRQPIIYAWLRDGIVLYIGMSRIGLSRVIGTHHVLSIFQETDELLIWQCATVEQAIAKERELILTIKPVYNNLRI